MRDVELTRDLAVRGAAEDTIEEHAQEVGSFEPVSGMESLPAEGGAAVETVVSLDASPVDMPPVEALLLEAPGSGVMVMQTGPIGAEGRLEARFPSAHAPARCTTRARPIIKTTT